MKKATLMAAALLAVTALYLYVAPGAAPGHRTPGPSATPGLPLTPAVPAIADGSEASAERPADGTEVVLGIRVRKDRNCTVELKDYVTPDGEMFSAYSCTPAGPTAEHPYAVYDNATLEAMAWSDADAASLLGRRLVGRDTKKSYEMLVRATALDGDTGHLYWLADQAFSAVRINEELHVANVMRRYELAALATNLGDSDANSRFWRSELIGAGIEDEQLDKLDRRVDELLKTVRDIQAAVFGEVRHGGQADA